MNWMLLIGTFFAINGFPNHSACIEAGKQMQASYRNMGFACLYVSTTATVTAGPRT